MKSLLAIEEFNEFVGLNAFETYTVSLTYCSCSKGPACANPGKHPKSSNWQSSALKMAKASSLLEAVRTGRCNYGLVTTGQTFVLDFDGPEGQRTYDYLVSVLPKLGKAHRVRTQSGGRHVYVRHDLVNSVTITNKAKQLPGMDVRGQGGFVIGPGSQGVSGSYSIEQCPETLVTLDAGDLETLLLHPDLPRLPKAHQASRDEGTRNDRTFKAVCAMRSNGLTERQAEGCAKGLNAFNFPPLASDELQAIAASAMRYEPSKKRPSETSPAAQPSESADEILPLVVDSLSSEEWRGTIRLDEFSDGIVIAKPLPFEVVSAEGYRQHSLSEFDLASLRDHFTRRLGEPVSGDCLVTAITVVAGKDRFHPVRDYLSGLHWDAKPRVEGFFASYFGAANDAYSQMVSRCLLLSMVARVMQPGCQVDSVVILEGSQGIGKSQGLRALGGEYFGDPCIDPANKDAYQQIHGRWLIEFAELDSFRRRGMATVKAFITTRIDRYRPPYGRVVKDQPRQCVFVGTTNESHYLNDPIGNRRFLPIKVTAVDVDAIADDRDQIFAEAVALFDAGESWWPEGGDLALARQEQEARVEVHPWEDKLRQLLTYQKPYLDSVSAYDLFAFLGIPENCKDRDKQTLLGQIMRNLGFERIRNRRTGTSYERVHATPDPMPNVHHLHHLHHLIPTSSPESLLKEEDTDTGLPAPARDNRDEVDQVVQVVTPGESNSVANDTPTSTDLAGGAP